MMSRPSLRSQAIDVGDDDDDDDDVDAVSRYNYENMDCSDCFVNRFRLFAFFA